MERRLMDFDLPEHPGLRRNFDAYLKMLGCDDGKPTVEQSRRAKIQLAQQGNIFFGTVLGRAGAKSVINGFQRGLAWLVKHGFDETTLRALNKCGIAVAVRTTNRMENDAATQWEAALKTTLKPGEDYAGWVDNINAVVFPGFFENRTRMDRHASLWRMPVARLPSCSSCTLRSRGTIPPRDSLSPRCGPSSAQRCSSSPEAQPRPNQGSG
jgi:hypothetical protein